ncbi:hypothetical protein Ddc_10820 [Ditylenchus destructor]|nr:hypothetical protein Ddc_10820 [Ditylenchus destructor]
MVDIKEIVANVWEPFGYSLVSASSSHSQLIPVLKKKDPAICEKVFDDWVFDDWVKISDKGLTKDPPVNLEPRDKFALNGYAKILPCYMKDVFNNDDSAVKNADEKWSKATIERWLADGRAGNFKFMNYQDSSRVKLIGQLQVNWYSAALSLEN